MSRDSRKVAVRKDSAVAQFAALFGACRVILPGHQSDPVGKMEVFQIFSKPVFLCLLLFTATLLVFWPVLKCDFVNYDDPDYFSSNPRCVVRFESG